MRTSLHSVVISWIILFTIVETAFAQAPGKDEWLVKPVNEKTYSTYLDFFSYDRGLAFDAQTLAAKDSEGIHLEHLSFQSTSGDRITANLFTSIDSTKKEVPALILVHGGSRKGKDGPYYRSMSEILCRAGFTVLSIDMKYFGERSTSLFTTFTEEEKHDRLYNQPAFYLSWIQEVVKDVGRSYDFLVTQRGVNPKRVGYFGLSRGAELGPIAAGVDKRLSPIVMFFGGHFDALETRHLPAACPANYIGRISPRPLLMINGVHDTDYIADVAVQPLYALAKPPKRILWTEGGHMFYSEKDLSTVLDWLHANSK